jgi:hypothetical protein
MLMPPYPVFCYWSGCGERALYKIAARWSDGITEELKTYALSCTDHLAEWYRICREKQVKCRHAPGETLDPPGIYELGRGIRDRALSRRLDLEGTSTPGVSPGQS